MSCDGMPLSWSPGLQEKSDMQRNGCADRIYENEGLPDLIRLMEPNETRVLDIGCGSGTNGRLMRQSNGNRSVLGITVSHEEAKLARRHLNQVMVADIEELGLSGSAPLFDAIIMSHVLEHLVHPLSVLLKVKGWLKSGGHIYVALPNVMYYKQRFEFLMGRFRYADTGIMDRTHLHFFDCQSACQMIRDAGFRIEKRVAIGSFPQWKLRKLAPGLSNRIDCWAALNYPNLFGWHILVKALK